MLQPGSIVLFLPTWIGDTVMATPALRALRQRFGSARLSLVGRAAALETLAGLDLAEATIEDRWQRRPRTANLLALIRRRK